MKMDEKVQRDGGRGHLPVYKASWCLVFTSTCNFSLFPSLDLSSISLPSIFSLVWTAHEFVLDALSARYPNFYFDY